ncbi:MAG: hypothetical protein IKO49_07630 [Bacilli bacterium]|nr:hypothetical protein [Bacilli bacterium]
MYIDLIVLIILILVVFIFFRKFSSIVYAIFIIDLILRGLTYIKWNIPLQDLKNVINKYIPESVPGIIGKYLKGLPYTIVMWVYIVLLFIFVGYLIRIFIKKRRH